MSEIANESDLCAITKRHALFAIFAMKTGEINTIKCSLNNSQHKIKYNIYSTFGRNYIQAKGFYKCTGQCGQPYATAAYQGYIYDNSL